MKSNRRDFFRALTGTSAGGGHTMTLTAGKLPAEPTVMVLKYEE